MTKTHMLMYGTKLGSPVQNTEWPFVYAFQPVETIKNVSDNISNCKLKLYGKVLSFYGSIKLFIY